MARSLLAGLAIVGMAAVVGLMLASGAVAADSGAPVCNGPGCVGGNGYGGTGAPGPGGFNQFWNRCCLDFHRNNSWPEPFLSADKIAVRTPYCIMTDNGWKMQNTIGSFLFDGETQRVNQAGDLLVKWIITQAPIHRRAVFVLKGDTAEATNARVQSVQAAVAKYSGGHVCPVLLTDTEPAGWSASYIDTITQQYSATIPAPRLPARAGAGGGQGGSGSGGGGGGVQ
ncbi:MAG TPA: hypothetical protein VKH44_06395 [Pirellulaceae bacterium]|nr:hypothetical protein [Pirellulaceae bacterium]